MNTAIIECTAAEACRLILGALGDLCHPESARAAAGITLHTTYGSLRRDYMNGWQCRNASAGSVIFTLGVTLAGDADDAQPLASRILRHLGTASQITVGDAQ